MSARLVKTWTSNASHPSSDNQKSRELRWSTQPNWKEKGNMTLGFTELPDTAWPSSQELGCTLPVRATASPHPCQQGSPDQTRLEPTVGRGQEPVT